MLDSVVADVMNKANHLSRDSTGPEAASLTRFLMDNVQYHAQVPIILGCGATKVEHKLSGLLWALYLETGSKELLKEVVSGCSEALVTDMGTEFAMNDYRTSDVSELLPTLFEKEDMDVDAEDVNECPGSPQSDVSDMNMDCDEDIPGVAPPPADPGAEDFLFPRSLKVPGICHICHNALKDVCSVLALWPELRDELSRLDKIFGHTGRRERFVATCIEGTAWSPAKCMFEQNCPDWVETRWGTLIRVCGWYMKRCKTLTGAWQARLYKTDLDDEGGNNLRNLLQDKDGHRIDLHAITRILQSASFWGKVQYFIQLTHLQDAIVVWASRCPCHGSLLNRMDKKSSNQVLRELLGTEYLYEDELRNYSQQLHCPLTGCFAPELALGVHLAILRQAADRLRNRVAEIIRDLAELGMEVSEDLVASIVGDFNLGVAHLVAVLELKTAFASTLPFAICGLAYHDTARAKQLGRHLVEVFDQNPAAALHDRVTLAWFAAGSPIRVQLDAWLANDDVDLQTLPLLHMQIAKKKLVPINETPGERPHGQVKTRIAFKASQGKQASLRLRLPEIKKALVRKPGFRDSLIQHIEDVKKELELCRVVGIMDQSPIVQAASHIRSHARKLGWGYLRKTITAVLYRFDSASQFQKHAGARKDHDQRHEREKRAAMKILQPKSAPLSFERLLAREWVQHLRVVLKPGDVLEVSADSLLGLQMSDVHGYQTTPAAAPRAIDADSDVGMDMDCDGDPELGALYLQVVHTSPATLRLVRQKGGAGRNFQAGDILIIILPMLAHGDKPLLRSLSAERSSCVLQHLPDNFVELRNAGFRAFSTAPGHRYILPGTEITDAAQAAVSHLVGCGAWKENSATAVAPSMDVVISGLECLRSQGYAVRTAQGHWFLSDAACTDMQFGKYIEQPRLLCEPRPLGNAFHAYSHFEMMLCLQHHGWVWAPLPPSRRRPALQNIDVAKLDGKRMWYGDFIRS